MMPRQDYITTKATNADYTDCQKPDTDLTNVDSLIKSEFPAV